MGSWGAIRVRARWSSRYAALLCVSLQLAAVPAFAWSSSGHMQIALLAYDALREPAQRYWVELLRQHPRFDTDFAALIPPEVVNERERARWIFARAATWPDLARSLPEYAHNTWHWVNWPLSLEHGRLATCEEARKAFPESARRVAAILAERESRRGTAAQAPSSQAPSSQAPSSQAPSSQPSTPQAPTPQAPQPATSILEALPNMQRVLADESAPPAERALALSWVLHLVGDAHQPLHAVALFTSQRFVAGDRGGNDILLRGKGPLHAVWDAALGEDAPFAEIERRARSLRANFGLRGAERGAARTLEIEAWIEEGCRLARASVYVPPVLSAVERFERAGKEGKPEVSLKPAYVAAAAVASRERAVQAGARLAALLERSMSPSPAGTVLTR